MEIDKIIKEAELAEQEVAELTSALVKFNTASSWQGAQMELALAGSRG